MWWKHTNAKMAKNNVERKGKDKHKAYYKITQRLRLSKEVCGSLGREVICRRKSQPERKNGMGIEV